MTDAEAVDAFRRRRTGALWLSPAAIGLCLLVISRIDTLGIGLVIGLVLGTLAAWAVVLRSILACPACGAYVRFPWADRCASCAILLRPECDEDGPDRPATEPAAARMGVLALTLGSLVVIVGAVAFEEVLGRSLAVGIVLCTSLTWLAARTWVLTCTDCRDPLDDPWSDHGGCDPDA